jgi:putative transposase
VDTIQLGVHLVGCPAGGKHAKVWTPNHYGPADLSLAQADGEAARKLDDLAQTARAALAPPAPSRELEDPLPCHSRVLRTRCLHRPSIHAWCVLPNHYHALIETREILAVLADLGRMHGRLSFHWNGEERTRGRQVWCGAVERYLRSDAHFWATMNYVHHNPVHHRYAQRWQDWPFSSATEYLTQMGHAEAARVWEEYPVLDYGKGWDDPEL